MNNAFNIYNTNKQIAKLLISLFNKYVVFVYVFLLFLFCQYSIRLNLIVFAKSLVGYQVAKTFFE